MCLENYFVFYIKHVPVVFVGMNYVTQTTVSRPHLLMEAPAPTSKADPQFLDQSSVFPAHVTIVVDVRHQSFVFIQAD